MNTTYLFHRHTLADLELLSCTDLAQQWGTTARRGLHAPAPLQEQCHFRELLADSVQKPTNIQATLQRLIAAAPESGLALHIKGRENEGEKIIVEGEGKGRLCCLRRHSHREIIEASMHLVVPAPRGLHDSFYEARVAVTPAESAKLCQATCEQTGHAWSSARHVRITSSECHQWFTYQGDAWQEKIKRHFTSHFTGNAATKYGQSHERAAIFAYEKQQSENVVRCGLVVPPGAPWLGCSPDGIVCHADGVPQKLIEVKCPVSGKDHDLMDMLESNMPAFLSMRGENVQLKRKHRYFSQVQLSMAILNVELCDVAVYSKVEDRVLVVHVPRDSDYCRGLISKLHAVYFEHMLPYLRAEFKQ